MCHIFCLVIVTEVGVWENKKCCGNTCQRASVFTALFLSSPKLKKACGHAREKIHLVLKQAKNGFEAYRSR